MTTVFLLAGAAGFVNALGSLFGRRAALSAVPVATLVFALNLGLAAAYLPWWWAPQAHLLPDPWWLAPAVGLFLLGGNICAMSAMSQGAVSLAVPVLSSKVVLVALGTVLLGHRIPAATWIGVILVYAGIVTLHAGPRHPAHSRTILLALAAALFYAVFDLLVKGYGSGLGQAGLLPAASVWCLVAFLPALAVVRPPANGRGALALCAGLNGIQTAALTGAIIMAGDATVPNVLYGCRGIWSVLLVLLLGAWLGLGENHDRRVIYRRLAGAAIIAAAIACTMLGGRHAKAGGTPAPTEKTNVEHSTSNVQP